MDHSLRCFGSTLPKTLLQFLLSPSLLLFIFFFSFSNAAFDLATIPFNDAYSPLFGDGNLVRSADGNGVQLLLDRFTGKLSYKNILICLYDQNFPVTKIKFYIYALFLELIYFVWWIYVGSGFVSSNMYQHGFFSANIKLPSNYSAGICVAFYVSIEFS